MASMQQFVAEYSARQTEDIDPALFDRTKEKSIAEYIIEGLKVIESLSYVKFTSWEHVTDASRIDVKLNRKHIKSRQILKDKDISKIVSIRDTAQEMLILKFRIDYDGETRYITKNLLIPAYIDNYHMLINGKEVLPQKQIVDMSTYSQKKSVKLKTTLTPIDVYKETIKFPLESTTGNSFSIKKFVLNLFTKEINPLCYYFAKFGAHKTIQYFGLSSFLDVVTEEYDTEINHYFRANKDILIEVDKRFFQESDFVRTFTYLVYDMFSSRDKFEWCDDIDFWVVKLGSIFTTNTKNQHSKGLNVLVSFERILDDITKETLRLGKKNLQSTYSLIRWMLGNYGDLRKKDNHDMEMKRLRCNEVTAFYFIQAMTYRINTLLNKKKVTIESIEKIFNWNPDELIRIMISSKNTLLKYDPNINNMDLFNALRVSKLGVQGISGGKNISSEFRDIYASELGRIDLNGISHGKNTALTGFITPRCKVYDGGFFSKESLDPDDYSKNLKALKAKVSDPVIDARRAEIDKLKETKLALCRRHNEAKELETRDGYVVIHKRYKVLEDLFTNLTIISARAPSDPHYQRTYRDAKGQVKTEDDYVVIARRKELEKVDGYFKIGKSGSLSEAQNEDNNILIDTESVG